MSSPLGLLVNAFYVGKYTVPRSGDYSFGVVLAPRQIDLSQYREETTDADEMMVDSIGELINLKGALTSAVGMFGEASARKHPQRALPRMPVTLPP